jgi:hypothetical protein
MGLRAPEVGGHLGDGEHILVVVPNVLRGLCDVPDGIDIFVGSHRSPQILNLSDVLTAALVALEPVGRRLPDIFC